MKSLLKNLSRLDPAPFIFSGFPLLDECDYVANLILPRLPQAKLPVLQGRTPHSVPETPLTFGKLK